MHVHLSVHSISATHAHTRAHAQTHISNRINAKKQQLISEETINKQNLICNVFVCTS